MAKFSHTASAEKRFSISLRKVARVVGGIVHTYTQGATITNPARLTLALAEYSEALGPWASVLVNKFLQEISANNRRAWAQVSSAIGKQLSSDLAESRIGLVARELQAQQVALIKSLPIEAGARAQALAQQAMVGGVRADEIAAELARTEEVTASRATLIARTEIAKANATLTQARAEYVGATHYVWRTAEDGDVREEHARLEGKVFAFDDPPEIEGEGAHGPGEIWNCRCYAEPVITTE